MEPLQGPLAPPSACCPCPYDQQARPHNQHETFHSSPAAVTMAVWVSLSRKAGLWTPVLGGVGEADRKGAEGDYSRHGALTPGGKPSVLRRPTHLSLALGPLPPLTPQPPEGLLRPCLCPHTAVSPRPLETAFPFLQPWSVRACPRLASCHSGTCVCHVGNRPLRCRSRGVFPPVKCPDAFSPRGRALSAKVSH